MAVLVNAFFEERVEQLFDLAALVDRMFSSAGLEYRVAGGLAAYIYVEEAEPDAGRLTKDIAITVRREDIDRIAAAAESHGLRHRYAAGVDMLVQTDQPSARRAVHMVFAGEKVRPEYPEPAPPLGPCRRARGLKLIPLADLVRMKLTSFRAVDEAHLKDLDEAGLITSDIEAALSPPLAARLVQMRARG